jgi:phage terminase small subunit
MTKQTNTKPKSVKTKANSVKSKPACDRPLTQQQEAFCQELVLNGGHQSDAYRKAYPKSLKWKDNAVNTQASILCANGKIQVRVSELKAKVAQIAEKKFEIDAEYVLRRHHEIDVMDVADILDDDGDILPIRQWPKVWRQSISGIEISELKAGKGDQEALVSVLKKIKWPDKIRNLELLGKHVSVNAYRDQVGVSDPNGDPLENVTRIELVPATGDN